MGCDKLKAFRALDIDNDIGDESTGLAYPKAPVDEVIAKLEAKNEWLKEETASWKEETTKARNEKMAMFVELANVKAENAELKDKIKSLENLTKASSRDFANEYNELKIEIFKHQGRINELETERDTFEKSFNEMTEAFTQSQRALWLMTAEWAEATGLASCNIAAKFMSRENFEVSDDYRQKTIKKYRHRQVLFLKYADYCRQKAEEYK